MNEINFEKKATNLLVGLLDEENIGYQELSERLEKIGIYESNKNLSNKIQNGKFSLIFVLGILEVLEKETSFIGKDRRANIEKEDFVDYFLEISSCFSKTESDSIYAQLDDAFRELYKSIGLTDAMMDDITNCDYIDYLDKDLKRETVEEFYDVIIKENEVSKTSIDILNRIKNKANGSCYRNTAKQNHILATKDFIKTYGYEELKYSTKHIYNDAEYSIGNFKASQKAKYKNLLSDEEREAMKKEFNCIHPEYLA